MSWENVLKETQGSHDSRPERQANRQWITRVGNFKNKQMGKPFDVEAYEGLIRHGNAQFKFGTTGRSTGMYMPTSQSSILLDNLQRDVDYHNKNKK